MLACFKNCESIITFSAFPGNIFRPDAHTSLPNNKKFNDFGQAKTIVQVISYTYSSFPRKDDRRKVKQTLPGAPLPFKNY
jgi:hypothetical protein